MEVAGQPFKQSGMKHERAALMHAAETGMNVYADWFYADASTVKETEYDEYVSNHYGIWLERTVAQYKELQQMHALVHGEPITGHAKLGEGITRTDYANGISVVVNHTDKDVRMNEIVIEAYSFAIGTGGDS